ncbi:MAG: pyridoxal 5'-phosphate synthase glutaminase subunit PdxT [Chloroflexota bacterium]
MTQVGVLALQGDVAEHVAMLEESGAVPVLVKRRDQLDDVDGLIIPGGESTTIGKLLRRFDMLESLVEKTRNGFPVYGTCAGMILLADRLEDAGVDQPTIGGMNITVRRNAFGRQLDSFETDVPIAAIGDPPLTAVFIRAPLITRVGDGTEVVAALPDGRTVAARQGSMLVSSFHPELTHDARMHRYFIDIVEGSA